MPTLDQNAGNRAAMDIVEHAMSLPTFDERWAALRAAYERVGHTEGPLLFGVVSMRLALCSDFPATPVAAARPTGISTPVLHVGRAHS